MKSVLAIKEFPKLHLKKRVSDFLEIIVARVLLKMRGLLLKAQQPCKELMSNCNWAQW